jgi:hypothetical protein
MLNHRQGVIQVAGAIWTPVVKPIADEPFVFLSINPKWPFPADLATHFVEEHAH